MSINPFNDKIRQIAERAAVENKVELVHADVFGSKKSVTVRIFIDKEGGVSVEDCSVISRAVEAALDADDFIPSAYMLEVSSPGIERELYSPADFVKFCGSFAKVRLREAINNQRNFSGQILSVEGEEINFADKTGGSVRFPYSSVVKANLEIDIDSELKNSGKR